MSKRVILTGAASGIGAETVARLHAQGTRVIGLDRAGDGANIIECDIRDQAAVEHAVAEAVDRLGGLDVLVNNAGGSSTSPPVSRTSRFRSRPPTA